MTLEHLRPELPADWEEKANALLAAIPDVPEEDCTASPMFEHVTRDHRGRFVSPHTEYAGTLLQFQQSRSGRDLGVEVVIAPHAPLQFLLGHMEKVREIVDRAFANAG